MRERLILHYSPLVKFVAGRVAAGLPQNIEQSDLVSYGIFGLIDAIDKFDPGRGFKFETYAISRIKGAIIDELRSIDWVPRSVRAKARAIERAYSKLENELRRSPEDSEVAAELDMTEAELAHTLSQITFVGLVALDELLAASSSDRSGSRPSATRSPTGSTTRSRRSSPKRCGTCSPTRSTACPTANGSCSRSTTTRASRSRRSATILGVTESRVCQIHTKAILQLRGRLSEPGHARRGPVRY